MSEKLPVIWAPGLGQTYAHAGRFALPGTPRPEPASYERLMRIIAEAGFEPHFVQLDWGEDDPHKWADDIIACATDVVQDRPDKQVVLGGFSFGALAAVLAAERLENEPEEVELAGLVAASLSPYFGAGWLARVLSRPEADAHKFSDSFKANLAQLRLPALSCPVQIFLGQHELPTVRGMCQEAHDYWPQSLLIEPDCTHDVFDPAYLEAISQNIGALVTSAV